MTRPGALLGWLSARVATARSSRFIRSSAGIGGLTVAELALGLVTAILLARALGAEGLGIYSLALAVVVLAGLPVQSGIPILVMREIAHHDNGLGAGVEKGVLIFAITVIALMSAVIIPLALLFGDSLIPGLDGAERAMLPVAVALIPVSALSRTIGVALAGKQMVVIGTLPQTLVQPGAFAIMLGAVSMVEPGWLTPGRAMALQLTAAVAALAVAGLYFLHHFSDVLRRSRASISWRAWGVATLRLGLANSIYRAQGQVLLLLTGALSSVEDVGLLRIAQRGAGLVTLGTAIAVVTAAPRFARLNAEGRHERLQHLLTQVARAGSALALIGLLGLVFGGHWLLATFFGTGFVAAWSALVILAAAETARALLGPGGMLLNMLRHEGVTARGQLIALVTSTSIAVALIPAYGADGAAWGMFCGIVGMMMFFRHKARRRLRLDPAAFGKPIRVGRMKEES